MSGNVTLFSGYSGGENRTTNYCLLVLKMTYEENPKFLSEFLSSLVDEEIGGYVGVKFTQQERKSASVPDGLIRQQPFALYIETKLHDKFSLTQLEGHLEALSAEPGLKVLMALGVFSSHLPEEMAEAARICAETYRGDIAFVPTSFEDFIEAMKPLQLSKNLADAVEDLEIYFDEQGLLPTWQTDLDVVNCGRTPYEFEGGVYLCPATGGSYNHKRCKFMGMYSNKCVRYIAEVRAVVEVSSPQEASLRWNNSGENETDLIAEAKDKLKRFRPEKFPYRVFVLDQNFVTDFRKDTKGGMIGSKQYFDVSALKVDSAKALAEALKGRAWTDELV